MKTLLALRHGKAEVAAAGGDKARELTARGRIDAQIMGRKVAGLVAPLDGIVTSDATRALQTAEIAATYSGFAGRILVEPRLYLASLETLLDIVRNQADGANNLLLIGHNPGLEQLCAELLTYRTIPPRLDTACLAYLSLDIPQWSELRTGKASLLGTYSPLETET
ncbi:MAG: histidine phosphatase family protein [Chloroflexota bacterium]|nr:histidine phosphatase family protein [Chloroflexota bacterium]